MATFRVDEEYWSMNASGTELVWLGEKEYRFSDRRAIYRQVRRELAQFDAAHPEHLSNAISTLKRLHFYGNKVDHERSWLLGELYLRLGRAIPALVYLTEAAAHGHKPDAQWSEAIANAQRMLLELPSRESYRVRVREVWARMLEKEATWQRALVAGHVEEVAEALTALLQTATPGMAIILTPTSEGATVYLRAAVNPLRFFALRYFLERMPESLKAHWHFVAGFPPRPTLTVKRQAASQSIVLKTARVELLSVEEGRFRVIVGGPKLTYREQWELAFINATLRELVIAALGELDFIQYVARIDLLMSSTQPSTLRLVNLGREFEKRGFPPVTSPEQWMEDQEYGTVKVDTHPDTEWRKGPLEGWTESYDLLGQYWYEHPMMLEDLEADGIRAGFFVIPCEHLSEDVAVATIDALAEHLLETCGQDTLRLMGAALGKRYAMLDCLCWDQEATIKEATAFAKAHSLEELHYQSFVKACSALRLWPVSDATSSTDDFFEDKINSEGMVGPVGRA